MVKYQGTHTIAFIHSVHAFGTRLFKLAQRFKAVNIGSIALFASRKIMLCLEKCPYNHKNTNFLDIKKRIL